MLTRLRIPSLSSNGKGYVVRRADGKNGSAVWCECPAFSFSTRGSKGCKHTHLFEAVERLVAACVEKHGATGRDGVCAQCLAGIMGVSARKVRKGYVPKPSKRKRRTADVI